MSHEKEGSEKSGKKVATRSLKEKRAEKATKRNKKNSAGSIVADLIVHPKK